MINRLIKVINNHNHQNAIVWKKNIYTYKWLKEAINKWEGVFAEKQINAGSTVALQGDFSPNAIALFITLVKSGCIIVPIATKNKLQQDEYCRIAEVEYLIDVNPDGTVRFYQNEFIVNHPLLLTLRQTGNPGLIIFSSGSTGKIKGVVHDFIPLLEKFTVPKRCMRAIAFLLFDHIGGINTLFYTLFNKGCLVIPENRSPQRVCEAIDYFNVQSLTTTPTFLNLLLISKQIENYRLKSLEVINYGTEVMSEGTLKQLYQLLPHVRFSQAYGLSETGVLPVRSQSSESLFVKLDGTQFQTRIVDGLLEIKSPSSMLGYLNASNPFTEDGWFKTNDAVEVNGEFFRVLVCLSELINVGGEKVYPAEIEDVIQQMEGVEQVAIYSEPSMITGHMVVAKIKLNICETLSYFRIRLYKFCKDRLAAYKIPQKIVLTNANLFSERYKKTRLAEDIK